jgi:hypothetical protein
MRLLLDNLRRRWREWFPPPPTATLIEQLGALAARR